MRDHVVSLARHGFDRFFFVNGHGGNIATIGAAFAEIHSEVSMLARSAPRPLRCLSVNWWDGARVAELRPGSSAPTRVATPPAAKSRSRSTPFLKPSRAPQFEGRAPAFSGIHDADDYRRRYPDGRIGSLPSLAGPEHGGAWWRPPWPTSKFRYLRFLDES